MRRCCLPSLFLLLGAALAIWLTSYCTTAGDTPAKASQNELAARRFTFKIQSFSAADVLKKLGEQTGNNVVDRRQVKEDKPRGWDFNNVPFWQAIDQIAAVTNSGISLYQPDGRVALVDAPQRTQPVRYGGLFRTAVKRIALIHDLQTDAHFCNILLEVAWEPRFQPFYLDPGTIAVVYSPDKRGAEQSFKQPGKGQIPVAGRGVAEIDGQVPAPDRSAAKIRALEGSFSVIGPIKMLTFMFDNLKTAPAEKVQEGASVTLSEFVPEEQWAVKIGLKLPKGEPRFESYQSWLGNNKIYLEPKAGGKQHWLPAGEQILKLTSDQAVVNYFFENPGKRNPADWRLVCVTPGRIIETTVPFAFSDLRLP